MLLFYCCLLITIRDENPRKSSTPRRGLGFSHSLQNLQSGVPWFVDYSNSRNIYWGTDRINELMKCLLFYDWLLQLCLFHQFITACNYFSSSHCIGIISLTRLQTLLWQELLLFCFLSFDLLHCLHLMPSIDVCEKKEWFSNSLKGWAAT